MKKNNLRFIVVSAIMGGLGAVLMFVEISIPIIPSFIKFDFSEIPVLLTSFACGPWYGVLVCLIKNLLHLFSGSSGGIGELSNFLLGTVLAIVSGFVYRIKKTRSGALIAAVSASLAMAIVSIFTNLFIVYPLYGSVMGLTEDIILAAYTAILPTANTMSKAILIFNFPFTFIKGIIDSLCCFAVYKRISTIIKGKSK